MKLRFLLLPFTLVVSACSDGEGNSSNDNTLTGHLSGTINIEALLDRSRSVFSSVFDADDNQNATTIAPDVRLVMANRAGCNSNNVLTCATAELHTVGKTEALSNALRRNVPLFVTLDNATRRAREVYSLNTLGDRTDHQMVLHNNKMMVVGGKVGGVATNDVMESTNEGQAWQKTTETPASFPPRWGHTLVSHNGKMIMTGGTDGETTFSDIWSSTSGEGWSLVSDDAPFGALKNHNMNSFNGKLYVIAGEQGLPGQSAITDRIWVSDDNGESWTELQPAGTHFSPRTRAATAVHFGKIWIMGGCDSDQDAYDDLWTTSDGSSWTKIVPATDLAKRCGHQLISQGRQLIIVGGQDAKPPGATQPTFRDDVIMSETNGIEWQVMYKNWTDLDTPVNQTGANDARWPAGAGHRAMAHGNHVDIVGGAHDRRMHREGVWRLYNGAKNWQRVSIDREVFSPRASHDMFVMNDKVIMLGGQDHNQHHMDMHSADADGKGWKRHHPGVRNDAAEMQTPQPRARHIALPFNNEIVIIGGKPSEDGDPRADVLKSADEGNTFTDLTPMLVADSTSPQPLNLPQDLELIGHAGAVIGDTLVILGGRKASGEFSNAVMTSRDAVRWKKQTPACIANPQAPEKACNFALSDHQLLSYNGKLYSIGGFEDNGNGPEISAQILETDDLGASWMPVDAEGFTPLSRHKSVVFNDMMMTIAGEEKASPEAEIQLTNSMRISSDAGRNWQIMSLASDSAEIEPRHSHAAVATSDAVIITGGMNAEQRMLNDVIRIAPANSAGVANSNNAEARAIYYRLITTTVCSDIPNVSGTRYCPDDDDFYDEE
ncbi:Uncharacterised protein [BD1-7 clade bacterium]|uniref:N-acetylneuraminate epimerase n=1 Tax=BD1-7 clade bacterium TaxID=2029982 RepID=A0A5S9QTE3_9GAMM|nr:Uncharacterised protein [BD1-7 clade bacterium]